MPGIDVAFEGSSGRGDRGVRRHRLGGPALPNLGLAGGWSAEQNGPALGAAPRLVTLAADPYSDRVMLAEQDGNTDLYAAQWSGSAWGTATVIETNTGETNNQPFGFVWDRRASAPVPHPPVFDQDLGTAAIPKGRSSRCRRRLPTPTAIP